MHQRATASTVLLLLRRPLTAPFLMTSLLWSLSSVASQRLVCPFAARPSNVAAFATSAHRRPSGRGGAFGGGGGSGIKESRSSSWTFKTKFPRAEKGGARGGGRGGGSGGKRRGRSSMKGWGGGGRFSGPPKKKTGSTGEGVSSDPRIAEMQRLRMAHAAKFAMEEIDNTLETRTHLKAKIQSVDFTGMGLRPEILDALHSCFGEKCKPTAVQALAIPASLDPARKGKAMLVGAETGSGKTLGYLIPLIQRLREAEAEEAKKFSNVTEDMMNVVEAVVAKSWPSASPAAEDGAADKDSPQTTLVDEEPQDLAGQPTQVTRTPVFSSKIRLPKRPRSIILVPTRDLVDQVTSVAKSLCSHNARLTIVGIHSRPKHAASVKRKLATSPIDVLVCTPKALSTHFEEHALFPDRVGEVVMDEADTLMDDSFAEEMEACLQRMDRKRPLYTFVSATFPKMMVKRLSDLYPSLIRITTPKLHKTLPGLKQTFLKISGTDSKQTLLLDSLKMGRNAGDRHVVVFCNRRESAEWVGDLLRGKGFNVGVITARSERDERTLAIQRFSGPRTSTKKMRILEEGGGNGEDEFRVLVATDAVSRGLDTVAVDHVILYEFPHTSMDYLHRVGRTARNGAKGRATSFIAKRDLQLATAIEAASKRGELIT
ncbi:hypothetical protein HDU67_008021 [Dinochytrium kinnereticum]|nr:hypothetical protein HDU67_008021 [Dinochytrium kinnereticum]